MEDSKEDYKWDLKGGASSLKDQKLCAENIIFILQRLRPKNTVTHHGAPDLWFSTFR